tara:strand:- start:1159 stop:2061 length:903 start_codon:yes stop_codon:yes gene_type:complete
MKLENKLSGVRSFMRGLNFLGMAAIGAGIIGLSQLVGCSDSVPEEPDVKPAEYIDFFGSVVPSERGGDDVFDLGGIGVVAEIDTRYGGLDLPDNAPYRFKTETNGDGDFRLDGVPIYDIHGWRVVISTEGAEDNYFTDSGGRIYIMRSDELLWNGHYAHNDRLVRGEPNDVNASMNLRPDHKATANLVVMDHDLGRVVKDEEVVIATANPDVSGEIYFGPEAGGDERDFDYDYNAEDFEPRLERNWDSPWSLVSADHRMPTSSIRRLDNGDVGVTYNFETEDGRYSARLTVTEVETAPHD